MPILAALLLIIQIAFAIHVVRTGREMYWIYIIVFIPAVGCIAYFFTQVLPDLKGSRTVRKAGNTLINAIDPQRELKKRKDQLELADTLDNRLGLANECLEAGMAGEAISLYQSCLKGAHEGDPHIMLRLAQAYFKDGGNEKCKTTLEELIAINPDFKSTDGHLLYARSLENLGLLQEAMQEYEVLLNAYPGEEARVRYGMLLQKAGERDRAKEIFQQTIVRARQSPKYYRRKEKAWIKLAQENAQ